MKLATWRDEAHRRNLNLFDTILWHQQQFESPPVEHFIDQSDFSESLGYLIKDFAQSMDSHIGMEKVKSKVPGYESHENDFKRAMSIIDKKRITKRELSSILKELFPKKWEYFKAAKDTKRQMLEVFFNHVSTQIINQFMYLIEHRTNRTLSPDPYLKGIMQRK